MTRFVISIAVLAVAIYMVASQSAPAPPGIPVICQVGQCDNCKQQCLQFGGSGAGSPPYGIPSAIQPVANATAICEQAYTNCQQASSGVPSGQVPQIPGAPAPPSRKGNLKRPLRPINHFDENLQGVWMI